MSKVGKDNDREYRIDMEVVVDAYDSEERAMGWYYYVSDDCDFPFKARCITERRKSPLSVNDEVEVLGTSPAEECEREIYVDIDSYFSKDSNLTCNVGAFPTCRQLARSTTLISIPEWSFHSILPTGRCAQIVC